MNGDGAGVAVALILISLFGGLGFMFGEESAYKEICDQKQGISVKMNGAYVCLKKEKV